MINRDVTMQDAVGETADGTAIDVKGLSHLSMQVTGTFSGTITFEATVDAANWTVIQVYNVRTGAVSTIATAAGIYTCGVSGLYQVRARVSGWVSGSITVTGFAINEPAHLLATLPLAANSGVDIGDVDVLSIAAGTNRIGKVYITDGTEDVAVNTDNRAEVASYAYGYEGSAWQATRIDASTWARTTIDYAHHEIHGGSHFYVEGTQSIANSASLDFLWVCHNSTKWPHALWEIDAQVEMTMSMYEDVSTSNNGTPVTIFNNNRNSDTEAIVTGFVSPTLTSGALGDAGNGGTLVWQKTIGSGKKIGGEGGRNHEFIGKQGSKYWFKISNASGGAGWVNYDFNWYEHTDKS